MDHSSAIIWTILCLLNSQLSVLFFATQAPCPTGFFQPGFFALKNAKVKKLGKVFQVMFSV